MVIPSLIMGEDQKPSHSKPWPPGKATEELRRIAQQGFDFCWTAHARDQMEDRGLIVGDVVHVLKHGFVYDDAEPTTRGRYFKYKMESTTPNSGNRAVRIVVIPQRNPLTLKVVTVMWVDEPITK